MTTYAFRGNDHVIQCFQERLERAGFDRVEDASAADVILTFCTSQTQLEDLFFEDSGLLKKMAPGALVIDMSPASPNFANEVHAVTTVSGFSMVAAPLSVKDKVAEHALERENLRCFCFGEDGAPLAARPILDVLVSNVEQVDSAGAAQMARSAITMQDTAGIISTIESVAFFKAARATMSQLQTGQLTPEACAPESSSVLAAVQEERFSGDYTVEMMMAELSSIMMAADDYELILPQVESAFHLLELLAIIGGADKNPAALILVYGPDREGDAYGLDWSRADQLYADEDSSFGGAFDEEDLDDDDGFEEVDEYLDEMFGIHGGYSSN